MTDFDKIALAAKTASDARIAEAAQGRQRIQVERVRRLLLLENELEEKIIPTFDEVGAAFERQGIPVKIERNWRHQQSDMPTVSFVCDGPPIRTKHGLSSSPRGAKIDVFQENGMFVVKLDRPRADGVAGFGGELTDALHAALEFALTSYIERRELLEGLC